MNSFIENEDIESRYGEEIYEDFTNYQKLQARIDKAIEYIENDVINEKELIEILSGEDNE